MLKDLSTQTEVTSLAARYRLPAVYPYRQFTELGSLLSYGFDRLDNFRRAATYADRILKGANPSELPVQAPVKFELVINLKTAKALGPHVPLQLHQRADEVIDCGAFAAMHESGFGTNGKAANVRLCAAYRGRADFDPSR